MKLFVTRSGQNVAKVVRLLLNQLHILLNYSHTTGLNIKEDGLNQLRREL